MKQRCHRFCLAPGRWVAAALAVVPSLAWAAEGGEHGAESGADNMALALVLLSVVATAYLLTHFVVDRLQRRFLLVTGIEYVLLGGLLGKTVGALSSAPHLAPVIAFAVGWVGLLRGTELSMEHLQRSPRFSMRLAIVDVFVTGTLVTAALAWLFVSVLDQPAAQALEVAAAMGCAAAAGSASASDVVTSRFGQLGEGLLETLSRASRLTELLAIFAFGVVLSIAHPKPEHAPVDLGPSDWVLVTLGAGVALGWLFAAFLGDDRSENSRFLALVGILSLATGAALFMDVSVLTVNLVLGLVLANTVQGAGLHETLARSRKPMVLVLLVLAGVVWRPVPLPQAVLVAGGFMGVRLLGKVLGGWLAAAGTPLRGDVVRGGLAQGEVSVAIALSMRLFMGESALVDLAFTGIVFSALVYELVAARLLKGLMVDAGELRQDQDLQPDGPGVDQAGG